MPTGKPSAKGKATKGRDGLTDRERQFVHHRRADPAAPNSTIMERAGYLGGPRELAERARRLLRKPRVAAAVYAPVVIVEEEKSDDDLIKEMRRHLLSIVRGKGTDADRIKGIKEVLSTVPGGYVPVQINTKGVLTLQGLVRAMGGAPEEDKLPEHEEAT